MKSLQESLFDLNPSQGMTESLFDKDIVTKDLFSDPSFKKWINQPDVLWYLYTYWESDFDDHFETFYPTEWGMYKDTIDIILKNITDCMKRQGADYGRWPWIRIGEDDIDSDIVRQWDYDKGSEKDFKSDFYDALHEIRGIANEEIYDIYKIPFRKSLPKNSSVTYLINKVLPFYKKWKINGGFYLTADEFIIIMGFPKGINNDIKKLFNL